MLGIIGVTVPVHFLSLALSGTRSLRSRFGRLHLVRSRRPCPAAAIRRVRRGV